MSYIIILSKQYIDALIKAGAVGRANAVTLESIGLKTARFLNPLVWKKYLGVADGNKVYVTSKYVEKVERRKRRKS